MSILKFSNGKNRGTYAIRRGINYILDPQKTSDDLVIENGISSKTPAKDMECVQCLLGKTTGRRYIHLVLSFDQGVSLDKVYFVTKDCLNYFSSEYQYLSAIHTNTHNLHAHIIINAVNIRTGKKFSQSRSEMLQFRNYVNNILDSYDLKPIGKNITETRINDFPIIYDDFFTDSEFVDNFDEDDFDTDNFDIDDFEEDDFKSRSYFGPIDSEEAELYEELEYVELENQQIRQYFQEKLESLPIGITYEDAESYYEQWKEHMNSLEEEEEHAFF